MKRILMIGYHFPPLAGSSGIQRTLRFVRYLPEFGWEPLVLSAHPRAYERTSDDLLVDVAPGTIVERATAFDAARHFAVGGKYPGFLARPDRWASWWPAGVLTGLSMIRHYKPDVIWSTYPIATAHRIGASLQKLTGLPWVADFRDPMVQDGYPSDPAVRAHFRQIEARAVERASLCAFTTPGTVRDYANRYPHLAEKFVNIENGYDEETFTNLTPGDPLNPGFHTFLHSGIVYPSERDPTRLLQALKNLSSSGAAQNIRMRFRAPAHESLLIEMAEKLGVAEYIEVLPPVSYREALEEMMRADSLLIMQAANCNNQIPAKLYEYLRAGRPILGLTDPSGDTATVLRRAGIKAIAPLDDVGGIERLMLDVIKSPTEGTLPDALEVESCSRLNRTRLLSRHLDTLMLKRP